MATTRLRVSHTETTEIEVTQAKDFGALIALGTKVDGQMQSDLFNCAENLQQDILDITRDWTDEETGRKAKVFVTIAPDSEEDADTHPEVVSVRTETVDS